MKNSETPEKYRVFIIDDHPLMLSGLARVLELEPKLEVCGTSARGKGAIDFLGQYAPDILLLDLNLKDYSGLELIKDLRSSGFTQPILVISMFDELLYAERVLKAGANGYMMKDQATETVVEGVLSILGGDVYLSETMRKEILQRIVKAPGQNERHLLDSLTDREIEVLGLIGQGHEPKEVAHYLGISPKTVAVHRGRLREKLGLNTASELLQFAVRLVEGQTSSSE